MITVTGVPLARRLHSVYAKSHLTATLYDVAIDGIHPATLELGDAEERAWIRTALERPVRLAVEAALDTLSRELETVLEQAPVGLVDKMARAPRWRDSGWG